MFVNLRNPRTNEVKNVKLDISWTVLFFGFLPALFRKDWKWSILMLLINSLTAGISRIIFMFCYNQFYIKDLLNNGFEPADEESKKALLAKGIPVKESSKNYFDAR